MSQTKQVTSRDIYLYIPNLIGYFRVFTGLFSFIIMDNHVIWFTTLYFLSCILDAFDGYAARKYNQSSKYGAILDMVTDRCTTTSLVCYLSKAYPDYTFFFQVLVSLDLASHYMHMNAHLQNGNTSHKNVDKSNYLLYLYYTSKPVLFTACLFNEVFYVALYLTHFEKSHKFGLFLTYFTAPVWAFKQYTNVVQMMTAGSMLAELDCALANNQAVPETSVENGKKQD